MNGEQLMNLESMEALEVDPLARWIIFNRLQELAIPCHCAFQNPLHVQVNTAIAAMQTWSVVRQFTLSRPASIDYLERCLDQQQVMQ